MSTNKTRIIWIDIAKALSLLFIMAAHTMGGFVLTNAFSFAVSLFFIFSGLTSKFTKEKQDIIRDTLKYFKKLMLPPAVTFILVQIYITICDAIKGTLVANEAIILHPIRLILTLIYSRCNNVVYGNLTIREIGILWFFAALFSTWAVYNAIQALCSKKFLPIVVIIISIIGFYLCKTGIILPLNLDIALTVIPYIYIAQLIKSRVYDFSSSFNLSKIILCFGLSFIVYEAFYYVINIQGGNYFDLASGIFPVYPLCFVMAIAGTCALSLISMVLAKFPKAMSPLTIIGQNTLYLYCIHSVDRTWLNLWQLSSNLAINYIIRLVVDIALMCVVMFIKKMANRSK